MGRINTFAVPSGEATRHIPFTAQEETQRDQEEAQAIIDEQTRSDARQAKEDNRNQSIGKSKAALGLNNNQWDELLEALGLD